MEFLTKDERVSIDRSRGNQIFYLTVCVLVPIVLYEVGMQGWKFHLEGSDPAAALMAFCMFVLTGFLLTALKVRRSQARYKFISRLGLGVGDRFYPFAQAEEFRINFPRRGDYFSFRLRFADGFVFSTADVLQGGIYPNDYIVDYLQASPERERLLKEIDQNIEKRLKRNRRIFALGFLGTIALILLINFGTGTDLPITALIGLPIFMALAVVFSPFRPQPAADRIADYAESRREEKLWQDVKY